MEALRSLMLELSTREERWKVAFESGEMSHAEASSAALEDRWAYAELAGILGVSDTNTLPGISVDMEDED
jgi:hypothetical protein